MPYPLLLRPPSVPTGYNVSDMTENNTANNIFFSLVIPTLADREKFNVQVTNVCGILDGKIPGCYEIVAIENRQDDGNLDDWDHVKGEVLVIIDGDLEQEPTTLADVIQAFKDGNDMAFASQYRGSKGRDDEPNLSYFGIKRSSLPRLHESPNGQKLILEILGPETIKRLSTTQGDREGDHILKSLRKIVNVRE